jgi:hypothetical protein
MSGFGKITFADNTVYEGIYYHYHYYYLSLWLSLSLWSWS